MRGGQTWTCEQHAGSSTSERGGGRADARLSASWLRLVLSFRYPRLLHHATPCCAMLRHVAPCCAMLRHALCCSMHHAALCCSMHYAAPCCAMLRHVAPCCATCCMCNGIRRIGRHTGRAEGRRRRRNRSQDSTLVARRLRKARPANQGPLRTRPNRAAISITTQGRLVRRCTEHRAPSTDHRAWIHHAERTTKDDDSEED